MQRKGAGDLIMTLRRVEITVVRSKAEKWVATQSRQPYSALESGSGPLRTVDSLVVRFAKEEELSLGKCSRIGVTKTIET